MYLVFWREIIQALHFNVNMSDKLKYFFYLQNIPTPEKEFAEYTFKHKINIKKSPGTTFNTVEKIAKQITALMNTSGGIVLLYHVYGDKTEAHYDKDRDKWIMGFEKLLLDNWIPESLMRPVVTYKYLKTDSELRIYIFVCRSRLLSTFQFHAYSRLAASVREFHTNDFPRVQELLHESHGSAIGFVCESQMKSILPDGGDFSVGDPIPATHSESVTMEFKHCYIGSDADIEKRELAVFSADILKKRLDKYMDCLCAFANTQGGSLVLGVEEGGKYPVVRGFPISSNQEAVEMELTEELERKLNQCIWHGDDDYKPVHHQDWDVHYHTVLGGVTERRMMEVCIAKHSGGMFLRSPVYFDIPKDWEGEESKKEDFRDWKEHFMTPTTPHSEERRDTHKFLKKHQQNQGGATDLHEQDELAIQEQPVIGEVSAEVKAPKSFKESQSEYKSDIVVHGIRTHDCCTEGMAERLQAFKGDIWYPSIKNVREQLPRGASRENLISFLEKEEWKGIVSVIEIERRCDTIKIPDGYSEMCHMLKISREEAPVLMCCFTSKCQGEITETDLESLVSFAIDSGRVLKRAFVMSTANQQHSCIFHFDMEVLRVSAEEGVQPVSVWNSVEVQPVIYPRGSQEEQYSVVCNGLSEYLLKTRDSVKDRYGDTLTAHLTEEQARILYAESKRILIVNGKSGTGKTVIALHLAMEAMEAIAAEEAMVEGNGQHVLYICSNEGLRCLVEYRLKSFVKDRLSRKYRDGEREGRRQYYIIVLKSTDAFPSQKTMLENAKLIIVDDVHAIQLHEDWESNHDDLYLMLFTHAAMKKTRVAIFFDPEQDYKKHLPADFDRKLRNLAEDVSDLTDHIEIKTLKKRIRNSQTINRFMQANQNQAKIKGIIECLNERQGDDIIYEYIGSNVEESANILNAKLDGLEGKYGGRSVAILCDDNEQMNDMKKILADQFNRRFQDGNKHPIEDTVICSIEDFGGQEAEVILFLLPRKFIAENIKEKWKYVNIISSRAMERLEFLLPWKSEENDEVKQEILGNLLELFKIVSSDSLFTKSAVT